MPSTAITCVIARGVSRGRRIRSMRRLIPGSGVFDDEHAFHLTATDDPLRNPAWREHYPNFDRSQSVKFGWLLVGGRKTRIKTASKLTTYDRVTCMPMQIDIQIVDEHDREHRLKGTLVAGTPIHIW